MHSIDLLRSALCALPSDSLVRLDEHLRVGRVFVGVKASVAADARLKVEDRFKEVAAAEVGPEHFGDVDLGVGDLPEQEVRDPSSPLVRMRRSGSSTLAV